MNACLPHSPAKRPRPLTIKVVAAPDHLDHLPDPEELPTRILHIAALRGLGYSLRTI